MSKWRTAKAAGLTLGIVATGIAASAQAQVQQPGGFGSITGFYGFRGGTETDVFGGAGATTPGRTLGGMLHGGYRFGEFDFAVGANAATLSTRGVPFAAGISTNSARMWSLDLEAGYNMAMGSVGLRPFIGVRYANARHLHTFSGPAGTGQAFVDNWGIGPRVGIDVAARVSEQFFVFGGGSAALLFGRMYEYGGFSSGAAAPNQAFNRTTWNLDAKLGIAYEPMPLVSIAAGYRVEYANGVDLASWTTAAGGPGSGRGNRFTHGPFVRLAYNFGPPAGADAVPPPPPPPPSSSKNYMVFFDFDRSNITDTAATTIRQAANDAKAGRTTRIGVTGHADRSGADAYNMALSMRRANAVKDQLVREGIAAASIAVVGQGESQPLVQTADGVREPQNRRVEIVLQ